MKIPIWGLGSILSDHNGVFWTTYTPQVQSPLVLITMDMIDNWYIYTFTTDKLQQKAANQISKWPGASSTNFDEQ